MKFTWLLLVIALLIVAGCKKKAEPLGCPEIIWPVNYTTFHSGDTISVSMYLPPVLQKDSNFTFALLSNNFYNHSLDSVFIENVFYPDFGTGNYVNVKMILRSAKGGLDTNYIYAGIGSPGVDVYNGVTIYLAPR